MDIDSILAIAVFMLVISWSFAYYYGLFDAGEDIQKYTIEMVADKIMGYISVDSYEIPVRFFAAENRTGQTIYFDYLWKNGTGNSSRIFSEYGESLACEFYGGRIYWKYDVLEGNNYHFYAKYAAADLPQNCTNTEYHSDINRSKAIPLAEERKKMISAYLMDRMQETTYYQFKSEQRIAEDFRVEITDSDGTFIYGIPLPSNRNVYVASFKKEIWESGKDAYIIISLW